jgi:hypothetical protein
VPGACFITRGQSLYAIVLNPRPVRILIRPPGLAAETKPDRTRRVDLLGHRAEILFQQSPDSLAVTLPDKMPTSLAAAIKIDGVIPYCFDSAFGQKTRRGAPQQDALIAAPCPSHARNGIMREDQEWSSRVVPHG